MRPSLPHPAPGERGFILVGVVTFMLALTILGLSLFALSSYEAQFFVASAAREQSLQTSEGGMELVQALLAAPGAELKAAHRAEGQLGITSALAYQRRNGDTTSAGPIDWDATVVIMVAARSGGVERTFQAEFIPTVRENPYQRLLTAGQGVSINTEKSTNPDVLRLNGRVWHPVGSDVDTTWTQFVDWTFGGPIERGTPPAALLDESFNFNGRLGAALNPDDRDDFDHHEDDNSYSLKLAGATAFPAPTFFRSPASPDEEDEHRDSEFGKYTFFVGADLNISVKGVAVWLVEEGACFERRVTVSAVDNDIPSALVIVARPNGRDANPSRGIWFQGGLRIEDDVPVYLVSDGDISVVHSRDSDKSNDARTISIVAGGRIEIGGPQSGDTFRLKYDDSAMDALADQLLALGALPEVMGGSGTRFALARPSWVETTPR